MLVFLFLFYFYFHLFGILVIGLRHFEVNKEKWLMLSRTLK